MRTVSHCISIDDAIEKGITKLRSLHWPKEVSAFVEFEIAKDGLIITMNTLNDEGKWVRKPFVCSSSAKLWVAA
jgi:hypothetical protein